MKTMERPIGMPTGFYPAGEYRFDRRRFRATGEYRPPRKGEWFLSGSIIEAYLAYDDLSSLYWIAKAVEMEKCPACAGEGMVEKPSKGVEHGKRGEYKSGRVRRVPSPPE